MICNLRAKIIEYDPKTNEVIIDIGGRHYYLDGIEQTIQEYNTFINTPIPSDPYFDNIIINMQSTLINNIQKLLDEYNTPIARA